MGMIDKIQAGVEKLSTDQTRLNAAEITTLQQGLNAMQVGLVKTGFYIQQAKNPDVRKMLEALRDDFLEPHMERPMRILEKAGIPYMNMNAKDRVAHMPQNAEQVYRDEEIMMDTVLAMQATVTGMQSGALTAVRGDVRDFFLEARDAAMDQWRKIGMVAMKNMPQMMPPTMSGVDAK